MPHTTPISLVVASLVWGAMVAPAGAQQSRPFAAQATPRPAAPGTPRPTGPVTSAPLPAPRPTAPGTATAPVDPAAPTTFPTASRLTTQPDYEIGPEDVLAVTVFDQPDLSGRYTVELDGTFSFPFIGRVTAGGQTIRAFETALRTSLADGFFKNPQVTVAVEAYRSQRIFVIGEVKVPGTLPLTGGLTLMEAIARAGSTTEAASDDVVIVRGGQGAGPATTHSAGVETGGKEVVRVNLRRLQQGAAGVVLRDGDTVFVGRLDPVYVYGQVKSPGSYPVRGQTTLLQALSLAGGGTPMAAINRARVIRVINGEKKEYRIGLGDLVYPGDTIMVPERYF
jgi:polysaccharide export outer membrane protein